MIRICVAVLLCVFSHLSTATPQRSVHNVGQKLIVDLRYFCAEGTASSACRTPLTAITDDNRNAITTLLTRHAIGGVILFSENITSVSQLVTLTYELQMIMKRAGLPALFIAIDQEGGRVARLPDDMAVRFSGNMAIGATYAKHGTRFARDVARGMATTLKLLGINVNFAPSLDVNANPDNPVINVRSYGEDPEKVARLGESAVRAMQQQGVVSAVKHFPGHGDTHTDSHSGLPRVQHDLAAIKKQDLLPFSRVIRDAAPAMVMTAHIQYPAWDNSTMASRDGTQTVVPATMSRQILTGLLREQLGFDGLIVSDAMDMAGIAAYFTPPQALVTAFDAGVDMALMPYPLRTPDDIEAFTGLLQEVAANAYQGAPGQRALNASLTRIAVTKKAYASGSFTSSSLASRIASATERLPQRSNQELSRALSMQSMTRVTPDTAVIIDKRQPWLFVMPDEAHCRAAQASALGSGVKATCLSYFSLPDKDLVATALEQAKVVVVGDITPQHAVYETGGLDPRVSRATLAAQHAWLKGLMSNAKDQHKTQVFVAMRAPYSISAMASLADMTLASYYYNVAVSGEQAYSVMFDSLMAILLGHAPASGALPVTVPVRATH